jgi:uncharacterized protein (DUF4415 family)
MKRKIVRQSSALLNTMRQAGKSRTDWARVKAMKDSEIDFSDSPELTPEAFAQAVVRKGLRPVMAKAQITLRLDADVLDWFRAQGRGYQTRINALLRAYRDAHRKV